MPLPITSYSTYLEIFHHNMRLTRIEDPARNASQDTKTAVFPITGLRLAACSSCFHASFRFSAVEIKIASSSLKWLWQEMKSFSSISKNIFLILWVRLTTAGFQWLWTFLSKAGNMMGRITCRLCAIKLTMWSLFHKKRALSATFNNPCWIEKEKCIFQQLTRW